VGRVARFNGTAAHLEEAELLGHAGGPFVRPDPLGDAPLTLELLAEA
jgi:hypothetical protein